MDIMRSSGLNKDGADISNPSFTRLHLIVQIKYKHPLLLIRR
jgi:hypothetical protein